MTILDPLKAIEKARSYCAFQERCHSELKEKLYGWGLHKKDVEEIMSQLVTEGFLNEERFAIAYAGGKFRIKHWGKEKIRQSLKLKKVSDYCIKRGLDEIDKRDYRKVATELINKKSKELKEPEGWKKNYKIAQYLISRGFENDLVWELLGQD
ncbi:MAG: regulatory protein RecX [Bacteroidota bacterium]